MGYFDFKNRPKKTNCLADVDILGCYDFNTCIISLDSLAKHDVERLTASAGGRNIEAVASNLCQLTPEQYGDIRKVLSLAAHEYTHFLDATSTIWGLSHLALMNKAYMSNFKLGGKEHEFYWAKRFFNHCRNIRFPEYYTVVETGVENTRPWSSEVTLGYIFDANGNISNKPVIFSKFVNAEGHLLARSPVSTVSLLEASATAQELSVEACLLRLTDEDFRLVEWRQFSEITMAHLYNKELTEYSVCSHLVSQAQKCRDVLDTFTLCSNIIRVVLNCPSKVIDRLSKRCAVGQIVGISEDTDRAKRLRNGLKIGDLGTLFYLVLSALPRREYQGVKEINSGIAEAISAIGLDASSLTAMRDERANQLLDELSKSPIKSIRQLAQAGYENLYAMDIGASVLSGKLNLPPTWLGDGGVLQLFQHESNSLRDFDLDACFEELYMGQSWADRFAEACL